MLYYKYIYKYITRTGYKQLAIVHFQVVKIVQIKTLNSKKVKVHKIVIEAL